MCQPECCFCHADSLLKASSLSSRTTRRHDNDSAESTALDMLACCKHRVQGVWFTRSFCAAHELTERLKQTVDMSSLIQGNKSSHIKQLTKTQALS